MDEAGGPAAHNDFDGSGGEMNVNELGDDY